MTTELHNDAKTGDGDALLRLLAEQMALYVKLQKLAESQRSLITGDQPEKLLDVLSQRQSLIQRLETVTQKLKPYQANWRQTRDRLSDDEARKADYMVGKVNELLREILANDEADAKVLSARKTDTSQAIGRVRGIRQASAAYSSAGSGGQSSEEYV